MIICEILVEKKFPQKNKNYLHTSEVAKNIGKTGSQCYLYIVNEILGYRPKIIAENDSFH